MTMTEGVTRPGMRAAARAALLPLVLFALPAPAQPAPDSPRYNTVDLQADAQREVGNDTLNAVLFIELNEADAAKLGDTLNRTTTEALAAAKDFKSVRVRTGNNQTYPVYDRAQRITGWRGRAELRLESKDFQAAAALIGRLQSRMQLGQIGFSVSPEVRKAAEDEIIGEAIKAFGARAEIVRAALGGRGYKIRRLAVNTGGGFVPRALMARAGVAAAEAVAAPPLEGGVSQITVSVSGTIEVE
jgi:predicted secreted protein